jgi:hypothetical protein
MTLRQSVQWLADIAAGMPTHPTVKVEDVGAQTWWIQEARDAVPGHVQPVSPGTRSKEDRIQDMSILFERGDVLLANTDVDDNLGYDPRFRAFIREWVEFGNGNSPDLLDATWYALQKLDLSRGEKPTGFGMDIYNRD